MAERNNNDNSNIIDRNKHIVLPLLVALTSSIVWALPVPSITASFGDALQVVPSAIILLVVFSIFLSVLAIASMSATPMPFIWAGLLASSFVLLCLRGFSTAATIAAGGFFFSMMAYSRAVRQESRERIHASPFKCSSTGYGGATFLFIAALSVATFIGAQGMTQFPIPQAAVELSISPLLSAVGCSGDSTLEECGDIIANKEIASLRQTAILMCKGDAACEALVDKQIAGEKASLVGQTKAKLAESLGVDKDSKERLSTLLASEVRGKLDEMLAPYRQYIAPLMALSVFTVLSSVSMLVRFPVLILSALFFALFQAFGLIKVRCENREVEIID